MRQFTHICGVMGVLLMAGVVCAQENLPPGAKLAKLEVAPASVELKTPYEYRQLLITGVLDNGDRVDLTRQAKFDAPAGVVKVSDVGQVRPAGDGKGEIKFAVAGQAGTIPAVVAGQKEKYQVSF